MKRFFLALFLMGASSLARADNPPIQLPEVTYTPNEDTFHQEQYKTLYLKTGLGIHSAVRTVFGSEMFSKSLGLNSRYSFRFPILVDIKDVPEQTLYRGLGGTAGLKQVDGQWAHVLTLNIGAYVQNPAENINQLLSHEMAHIVLADFMGTQDLGKVPMWLNEGIAQSVTDEGRTRVSDLAASLQWTTSMLLPCDLDAPVDSFAHGEGNGECYPQYYLATQRLNQLGGITAVGRVLKNLTEGQSIAEAVHSATGVNYSVFKEDVDAFIADVITDRKPIP